MPAKPKFEPRKLMEMAIKVMKQSVHEPRFDGKPLPNVGAVLYKSDGSIENACRGELRWGEAVGSDAFNRRLAQQGLLQTDGNRLVPSGFGALLFGTSPRDLLPQVGLLGTIHYPNGKEEARDFDGPQVVVPEQAIEWLKNRKPSDLSQAAFAISLTP
jgi:predicted HTH transcriptional regulator